MSTVTWEHVDTAEFLRDVEKAREEKPTGPHRFVKRRLLPWVVCARCGLIALRNRATERAMRRGC